MPEASKKLKLNRFSKAFFMRHASCGVKKKRELRLNDYLKFPKISKEFLFVANSHKIYSLLFSSTRKQECSVYLKVENEPFCEERCIPFDTNFEKLQNLSKCLNVGSLNFYFYYDCIYKEKDLNKGIGEFRKLWTELYPGAKINLVLYQKEFNQVKLLLSLVEELSLLGKLHNIDCHANMLIDTNQKLTLNSCVLKGKTNMVSFNELMKKEHKIKKLKFSLCRVDNGFRCWEKPIPLQKYFDNFPTNYLLKQLDLEYKMETLEDKNFDPLEFESFLALFPNLTKLNMYFKYWERYGGKYSYRMEDAKELVSNSLNFIQEIRLILAEKRPSIELGIYYDFQVDDLILEGFEKFDEWTNGLFDHSEFTGIDKNGPAFYFYKYSNAKFEDGKFKYSEGEYHSVLLKWKHQNFNGKIRFHVTYSNSAR